MHQLGALHGRSTLLRQTRSIKGSRGRQGAVQVSAALKIRPYTVRKGDTLASIAQKREISLPELKALNHDINPDRLVEGQTILMPGGKLSDRDHDILAGIGPTTYRTYPVREGEVLSDIILKRNISREEMGALNPGVNLDKLTARQVIKLPAGKYTVREREMLTGSGLVPADFFTAGSSLSKAVIGFVFVGVAYSFWLWRQKRDNDANGSD